MNNEALSHLPPNQETDSIDYKSNIKHYKDVFGGKRPDQWNAYLADTKLAYEIRDLLIKIALTERANSQKGTLTSISDELNELDEIKNLNDINKNNGVKTANISQTMLSSAAWGKSGNKPKQEYRGLTSTEFIFEKLTHLFQIITEKR